MTDESTMNCYGKLDNVVWREYRLLARFGYPRNTPGVASQRGPKVNPFDCTANTSEVFLIDWWWPVILQSLEALRESQGVSSNHDLKLFRSGQYLITQAT